MAGSDAFRSCGAAQAYPTLGFDIRAGIVLQINTRGKRAGVLKQLLARRGVVA